MPRKIKTAGRDVAQKPSCFLLQLPDELLEMIFSLFYKSSKFSKRSLLELLKTCKSLYHIGLPLLFREVTIPLSADYAKFRKVRAANLSHVRTLRAELPMYRDASVAKHVLLNMTELREVIVLGGVDIDSVIERNTVGFLRALPATLQSLKIRKLDKILGLCSSSSTVLEGFPSSLEISLVEAYLTLGTVAPFLSIPGMSNRLVTMKIKFEALQELQGIELPKLRSLVVDCTRRNTRFFDSTEMDRAIKVFSKLPTLEHISLDWTYDSFGYPQAAIFLSRIPIGVKSLCFTGLLLWTGHDSAP